MVFTKWHAFSNLQLNLLGHLENSPQCGDSAHAYISGNTHLSEVSEQAWFAQFHSRNFDWNKKLFRWWLFCGFSDQVIKIRQEVTSLLQIHHSKMVLKRSSRCTWCFTIRLWTVPQISWLNPRTDNSIFSLSPTVNSATKRDVLSTIARFYDPLGLT